MSHPTQAELRKRYTHYVQYQQPDRTWRDGFLAYTEREAKGVAKAGAQRTGRPTRVRPIAE